MQSEELQVITDRLQIDLEDFYANKLKTDSAPRKHLGGSRIGEGCSRRLWYEFRHVQENKLEGKKRSDGQVARVFERGHREEPNIIAWLKAIGCTLYHTPEDQVRISDCSGHFGGSLDNIGRLPEAYGIDEDVLFEFKTINTQEFAKLKRDGVQQHSPKHWSQICVYGFKKQLKYALYISVDKNTEEIHMEFLVIDWELGRVMLEKALSIITSPKPMHRISQSAAHFSCKWCPFTNVCHYGEVLHKNCRTCVHSQPVEDGKWLCQVWGQNIPDEAQKVGCDKFQAIRD